MSTHNTEKLVRKCFQKLCFKCVINKSKEIARAARRFVKMEQAEKLKATK